MTRGNKETKTDLSENVWKVRETKQIFNLEKNTGLGAQRQLKVGALKGPCHTDLSNWGVFTLRTYLKEWNEKFKQRLGVRAIISAVRGQDFNSGPD